LIHQLICYKYGPRFWAVWEVTYQKKMRTVQIFYSNISNGLDNYSKVRKD
jgi:hypothetical protein